MRSQQEAAMSHCDTAALLSREARMGLLQLDTR